MLDRDKKLKDYGLATWKELLIKLETFKGQSLLTAIDAPLSLPQPGRLWRGCDKELQKMKIPCFAPAAPFFIEITRKGIELRNRLQALGFEVLEVYPYASRVRLGIGAKAKKNTSEGRKIIQTDLIKKAKIKGLSKPEEKLLHSHLLDALVAAYTGYLKDKGRTETIKGPDGTIFLPLVKIGLTERE